MVKHGGNGLNNNNINLINEKLGWNENSELQKPYEIEGPDNLIAYYFRDVRENPLLTRHQETAGWIAIENAQYRVRRALYLSPPALGVLTKISHRVVDGEIQLSEVYNSLTKLSDSEKIVGQEKLSRTLEELKNINSCLNHTRAMCRRTTHSVKRRHASRQYCIELWRRWIALWDEQDFHPYVFEALESALRRGVATSPQDARMRASYVLWSRYSHKLEEAEYLMLKSNLRLVIRVATRYRDRGMPFLDLIQEGNKGLMRALKKFEYKRGLKFVTYAHWWVRQSISRAISEQNRTVRLPNHLAERRSKLRKTEDALWDKLKRAPDAQEIAEALDWSVEDVEIIITNTQPMMRLNQQIADDDSTLIDVLEDKATPGPDQAIDDYRLEEKVKKCLNSLSKREAHILRLRFGLDTDHSHTLQEIADILGLSRERIRQIEQQALDKLRQPHRAKPLIDYSGNI